MSVINVTAVDVVLLICLGKNNYRAPLVIPLPVEDEGHKCKQRIQRRTFCTYQYIITKPAVFYAKVYVALWHHPSYHPLLLHVVT